LDKKGLQPQSFENPISKKRNRHKKFHCLETKYRMQPWAWNLKLYYFYLCLMADVFDSKMRSYNMSRIKGKDTKPEILVRKYLHKEGFRFRLNDKKLPGKPDIVLPKYKTVIFINGCFWHGHDGCKYFVIPKTRTQWWSDKINQTKLRDFNNYSDLKNAGWKVIVLWECELKSNNFQSTIDRTIQLLKA
jgi:DNA mismatch endonuclease (patch repair protein)